MLLLRSWRDIGMVFLGYRYGAGMRGIGRVLVWFFSWYWYSIGAVLVWRRSIVSVWYQYATGAVLVWYWYRYAIGTGMVLE